MLSVCCDDGKSIQSSVSDVLCCVFCVSWIEIGELRSVNGGVGCVSGIDMICVFCDSSCESCVILVWDNG